MPRCVVTANRWVALPEPGRFSVEVVDDWGDVRQGVIVVSGCVWSEAQLLLVDEGVQAVRPELWRWGDDWRQTRLHLQLALETAVHRLLTPIPYDPDARTRDFPPGCR